LTPREFLRRHWQKKPLLARGAIAHCGEWLTREHLFELATREAVESRLVLHARGRWRVEYGPFAAARLKRLPARGWTLLVQGVEQHDAAAAQLLRAFAFIPHARLDDLMVSHAPPGGGVGPHFDSYDVFLLQGPGMRRWRISAQRDLALLEDAPLRILKRFRHTREWVTQQGDLLYLPPRNAHEGVAVEPCMTLSVGFRAPRRQELASRFLEYLQDELDVGDALYADPHLMPRRHAGELPRAMLNEFTRVLARVRWQARDVERFAGRYLTEPKAHVVFHRPRRPLTLEVFARRAQQKGVALALASRLLFKGGMAYLNGEAHAIAPGARAWVVCLADRREAPPRVLSPQAAQLLHAWYRAGHLGVR
jgi:50S ribosomal protein L16 3-hydroxylase